VITFFCDLLKFCFSIIISILKSSNLGQHDTGFGLAITASATPTKINNDLNGLRLR